MSSPELTTPRAAYLHIPFCAHRCGYCNFTVVARRDDLQQLYLDALETELSQMGQPREVDTLYLGGGTPSQLTPENLQRLLELARHWFPLTGDGELTIEANPADLDAARLALLERYGVTRVSLGGQSFQEEKLALLERDHTAGDVERCAASIRDIGADVALDLMFGTPGESIDSWQRDLHRALALETAHLSTYGLTFEKGTAFWSRRLHGELCPLDEQTEREMFALAIDTLTAGGLEHYEVSNFARPGRHSRHNQVYWDAEPFYAAGAGAARYVSGRRETNHRSTTTYIKRVLAGQSPVAESEELGTEDRAREALVLGLRRVAGVNRARFAARMGVAADELIGPELPRLVELGMLEMTPDSLRLTRQGLFVSDSIWPLLLRV